MTEAEDFINQQTVGLLLIGGIHHILHLVPIAAELEAGPQINVIVYVTSDTERRACTAVLTALNATRTQVIILRANALIGRLSPKLGVLLSHLKIWKQLDALIVAERTSTIIRYMSPRLPVFIHIPHGAGDRAKSYDKRIRHFDHVLSAGAKDKQRMIELGLVKDETCHVTGYIKPYAVKLIRPNPPRFFNNTNPVVLYNPHFDGALSSWPEFGLSLLTAFAQHPDMNFIIAPHIRLFSKESSKQKTAIEAFSQYDNIHIDLGSEHAVNMDYTRAADIYLGDVSSQVYEFLSQPKPCIFITNAQTQWDGNPDYAHWTYGPVCHSAADVIGALTRAFTDLETYAPAQIRGCLAAKGEPSWNPIRRAANVVKSILSGADSA